MITQSVLGYACVLVSCKHHYRKVRCECQSVCVRRYKEYMEIH